MRRQRAGAGLSTADETGGARTPPFDERELTQALSLCDKSGRLLPESIGWSRHPLHRSNLKGHWPRKKRWNYWCVTDDKRLFSVTLASVDYLGLAFAYFLDFDTKEFIEQTVTVPLGRGCALPDTVDGDIAFENRRMSLSFTRDQGMTRIHVNSPEFGGRSLSAEITVEHPRDHETLNVVIPWSRDRFHFTSKQNCLPASGSLTLGDAVHAFDPETAFACLDFGRGVWRYSTIWNWASLSGKRDGRTIGLNLGGTWTDGTGMTENAICLDGRISKLSEDVRVTYDRSDFTKPWTLGTEASESVDLRFVPFFERVAKTDLLVLKSEVHQLIGRFSGRLVAADGDALEVEEMIGWVEQHEARW